jgi:HEAT repeat protein
MGAKAAVPKLAELTRADRDADVRSAAAAALGKIGDPAPAAVTALRDAVRLDPSAAPAARRALRQLGLKPTES